MLHNILQDELYEYLSLGGVVGIVDDFSCLLFRTVLMLLCCCVINLYLIKKRKKEKEPSLRVWFVVINSIGFSGSQE